MRIRHGEDRLVSILSPTATSMSPAGHWYTAGRGGKAVQDNRSDLRRLRKALSDTSPLYTGSRGGYTGRFGWGGWTRTNTIRINSAVSYQLDHAPVFGHINIRCKGLVHVLGHGRKLLCCLGASFGASWNLWNGPGEALNGGEGVGRGKVRIPHSHGDAFVP
jgi:hypothetical protein